MADEKKTISRREFLQQLTFGAVGAMFVMRDLPTTALSQPEIMDPRHLSAESQALSSNLTSRFLLIKQEGEFLVAQCSNGKYLRWTTDSNLVWIQGGEVGEYSTLQWGLPEIAAYQNDLGTAIDYNNLVENSDGYFLAAISGSDILTQKMDTTMIQQLWGQTDRSALIHDGLVFEAVNPTQTTLPITAVTLQNGFAIEGWFKVNENAVLVDVQNSKSNFTLEFSAIKNTFGLSISDGFRSLQSHGLSGNYIDGNWHHVNVIVDSNPKIIRWIIDGNLTIDNQHNTTEFSTLSTGNYTVNLNHSTAVQNGTLRIYNRALRNAELLSSYHSYGQGMGKYDYEG